MADNEINVRIVGDSSNAEVALSTTSDATKQAAKIIREGLAEVQATAREAFSVLTSSAKDSATAVESAATSTSTSLAKVKLATGEVTTASGQMRFAMRDLSYQINDIATMFAMGASPMMIFASQGGQVVGALSMMTGEATGLLGVLGSPWTMIAMSAAMALGPLIGKLFETGDAAETAKGKINEMQQALDRLDSGHGRVSMEDLGEAQKALFAAQNRVHELDIKQARTRGEAIEKAKALAEATKDLETAQDRVTASQMRAAAWSRLDGISANEKADKRNASQARAADRAAAREAAREDRERTEAEIAEYRLRIDAADGNMREKMRIAQEEATFLKGKFGEESRQYREAQDQIVRIKREAARQQQQLDTDLARAKAAHDFAEVNEAEADAQFKVQIGQLTAAQMIEMEREFENKRFAIRRAALIQERSLIDPSRDPVRYQQMSIQIEALDQQHQTRMTTIERQGILERNRVMSQSFRPLAQELGHLLTLQQGFFTSLRNMWRGLVGVVDQAVGQMVERWLVGLATKEAASKSFHLKQVLQDAKQAAAGAFNAVVRVPFVGPVLAPPAAAAAFAGVMAFSARDGYDVPAMAGPGIDGKGGQIGVVHPREMVLPADLADRIRSGDGGGGTSLHLHGDIIHNPRQLQRWFESNKSAVAAGVKRYARDNGR